MFEPIIFPIEDETVDSFLGPIQNGTNTDIELLCATLLL